MADYDSRPDTLKHIREVRGLLRQVVRDLRERGNAHDASKLVSPEVEAFDIATPKLRTLTYGTAEYRQALDELGPALEHHYLHNDHHPEHFSSGIDDMDLMQVAEMPCD